MFDGVDSDPFSDRDPHRRALPRHAARRADVAYTLLVYAISLAAGVTGLLLVVNAF